MEKELVEDKDPNQDQFSASVVQVTTTRVTSQEISPKKITDEAAEEIYPKIKHSHNVDFTEEGRPYQATPIADIQYDEDGVPQDLEVKYNPQKPQKLLMKMSKNNPRP